MKSRFFCLLLSLILWVQSGLGQTVLYSETFTGGVGTFTLNAADLGSDPAASGNRWVVNPTYNSFFGNTPAQPAAITNANTNYLHIRSGLTANATFLAPADGDKFAKMSSGVSTIGATNVTLSFWLLCNGDAFATDAYFGRTFYSVDGGVTWIQNPATYSQISSWTFETISNPAFDNQADLRFAFMWSQVSANEFAAADPSFSVDDIKIEGITSTNTITTNAPSPAGPYCAGAAISVPFISTGTFAAGNTYTVQLSDATGSFASPVNIGSLNSTANSGTIAATIPGGTPAGTGYLIRVISSNPSATGTTFGPFTVNTTVTPSVSITANPGNTVCAGASVSFTANPVNGGTPTYQWQVNGTNVGGATASTFTTTTLNNNDVVSVIMTSNAACASPTSVTSNAITMTVNPVVVPSVSITANPGNTVCAGASVSFTANPVNGGTPTYQWQVNGTNVGGATASTFTTSTLNNNDVVSVIMTSNAACASPLAISSNSITISVVNNLVPSVSVTSSPLGSVCSGTSVTFTAVPLNGGSSPVFQWQINGTNVGGAVNSTFTTTALNNNDVVTVVLTSNDPCANPVTANSAPLTVTVSGVVIPAVTVSLTQNLPACSGAQLDFTATATNGGSTPGFQWQVNGTNVGGATSSTFSTSTLSNGDQVSVTLTSSDLCAIPATAGSSPINIIISNVVAPTVALSASADTICAGDPVLFSTSITNGGTSPGFQWLQNGNPIAGQTASTLNSPGGVTISNNDVITVILTSSDACANPTSVSSNAVVITVSGAAISPTITISTGSQSICAGDLASFTASVTNGGTAPQIQWQVNGVNVPGGTGVAFSSLTLSDADIVTATVLSNAPCAPTTPDTSNSIIMTVNPPVTPTVTVTATPSTICQGQSVTYTINATGTGISPGFQWLLNGLALPGQTGNTYTNNAITGSDQVSVQMQSNAACVTINPVTSQAVGVTVLAPETPSITLNVNDSIICSNEAPVFTAIFTNGGTSPIFNWYVSGSLVASTATPVFTPVGLSNGQSVACEIVSNYQCATPPAVRSSAISIIVSPQPVVEAGADVSTPLGTPVQLNASFNGAYDYLWNPAAGLSCTACINPLASPDVSTIYVVEAIDTLSGCTAFDSLRVEVFELIDLFVPTAFSPNNDQNNDVLYVRGNGIRDIEFTIYNRNGEMIFKSLTQTQGWDGTYKGQDLDSGVFNYLLTGTFKDGKTISQSGNVTLQR